MQEYYFTFRSLTSAQQALFELNRNGVSAVLTRTPRELSSMGCGYGLRFNSALAYSCVSIFRNGRIRFEKAFVAGKSGQFREVSI